MTESTGADTPASSGSEQGYPQSGATQSPWGSVPPAFAARPPRRAGAGMVAAVAVAALVGGGIGTGATLLIVGQSRSTTVSDSSGAPTSITINDTEDVTLVSAVAAKSTPSVVTINVSSSSSSGSGSGVILSADGYVVTNNHVVTLGGAASSAEITATASDGTIYQAEIVGTDPVLDLAVIKLTGAVGLQAIEFADSDDLNVGDQTIAIGAPLGLSNTVTSGIISALNRSITVASSEVPDSTQEQAPQQEEQQEGGTAPYDFWGFGDEGDSSTGTTTTTTTVSLPVIQTDASINPGNSGGALLNAQGQLIGINVAIATTGASATEGSGSIGVGFSIPANVVQRITDELIAEGAATHGLLGAMVYDAALDEGAAVAGAAIESVTEGGAAALAGLASGDVVTRFNGVVIATQTDLTAQVRTLAGGSTVTLVYVRNGTSHEVEVTLGSL